MADGQELAAATKMSPQPGCWSAGQALSLLWRESIFLVERAIEMQISGAWLGSAKGTGGKDPNEGLVKSVQFIVFGIITTLKWSETHSRTIYAIRVPKIQTAVKQRVWTSTKVIGDCGNCCFNCQIAVITDEFGCSGFVAGSTWNIIGYTAHSLANHGFNFSKTNGQDNISHFLEKHLILEAFVPGNCLPQILSVAALPIKLELTK